MSTYSGSQGKPARIARTSAAAILAFTLTFIPTILTVKPASAYTHTACWMRILSGDVAWQWTGGSSTMDNNFHTLAQTSTANWNATNAPVDFVESSRLYGNFFFIDGGYLGSLQAPGFTTYTCNGSHQVSHPQTNMNYSKFTGYTAGKQQVGAIMTAVTHEMGHAVGLGHTGTMPANGCPSPPAIMWSALTEFTRCGWSTPKADDVNGIWWIYNHP